MKKYDVKYQCGCIHEIEVTEGIHRATGNNKDCERHKN